MSDARDGGSSMNIMDSTTNATEFTRKVNNNVATTARLRYVLDDDKAMRERFRRYLKTLKSDENVYFWDMHSLWLRTTKESQRIKIAQQIMETFVVDNAKRQVNLKSTVRNDLIEIYNDPSKRAYMGKAPDFFAEASDELFKDLKVSFTTFVSMVSSAEF